MLQGKNFIKEQVRFNHEPDIGGSALKFRLIYRGKLPAASASSTRNSDKHRIRQDFNIQLREYWRRHPELIDRQQTYGNQWFEEEAKRYERCGHKFIPLLSERHGLACAVDILFLRRDLPGRVLNGGGDIDNRLKVLFDAFRIPATCDEIPQTWTPSEAEKPLYCLLDDDKLITTISVRTDQLLTPINDDEAVNDVVLIIKVKALLTDFSKAPWGFLV